jgi:hypothetical protein
VADFAESLRTVVYSWDPDARLWVNSDQAPVDTADRIRVDVELVVRGRSASDRLTEPVPLQLQPGTCVPDCVNRDAGVRRVHRTTVEIKNSGV